MSFLHVVSTIVTATPTTGAQASPPMSDLNLVSTLVAAFAAISAGIAAVASVVIIFVYQKQVKIGQNQVRVSQDQVDASLKQLQVSQEELKASIEQVHISQNQLKLSQEQIYDQHRPILVLNRDKTSLFIENAGTGVALNIRGAIFNIQSNALLKGNILYALRNPLPAGQRSELKMIERNPDEPLISISYKSEIGWQPKYTLRSREEGIDRLTLTCHDIFGRKHASIFEGKNIVEGFDSRCISVLFDIPKDIEELERDFDFPEKLSAFVKQEAQLLSLKELGWDDAQRELFKAIVSYGQEQGVLGDSLGRSEEDFIQNLAMHYLKEVMEDPYCRELHASHQKIYFGEHYCYGGCMRRKNEHQDKTLKHLCNQCYSDF